MGLRITQNKKRTLLNKTVTYVSLELVILMVMPAQKAKLRREKFCRSSEGGRDIVLVWLMIEAVTESTRGAGKQR